MSALFVSDPVQRNRPRRVRVMGGFKRDLPRDHRDAALDFEIPREAFGHGPGVGPAVLQLIANSRKAGYRLTWEKPQKEREGEMHPAVAAHLDAFCEQLAHHFHASPLLAALFEHGREAGEFLEALGPSDAEWQAQSSQLAQARVEDMAWLRGRRLSPIVRATMPHHARTGLCLR